MCLHQAGQFPGSCLLIRVVFFDQVTKYWIRTDTSLQNTTLIDGWLRFNYTQNPGMALGIEWLSTPVISSVAIIATIGILTYIVYNIDKTNEWYLVCMGFIIGGSLGNISDRLFMGLIEGYGGVLEGHVVDFIHFSLQIDDWPVFPYIFNVADVAISCSIIALLIFNKRLLPAEEYENKPKPKKSATVEEEPIKPEE